MKAVDKKNESSSMEGQGKGKASLEELLEQMMDEDGLGLESKRVES